MKRIGDSAQGGLLASFIIPFVFMLFMKVSMDRVWATYYMLQLIGNITNFTNLLIPANAMLVISLIQNVAYFKILENEFIQRMAKKYVFNEKTLWIKSLFMDSGVDVTNQVICVTILLLILAAKKVTIFKSFMER